LSAFTTGGMLPLPENRCRNVAIWPRLTASSVQNLPPPQPPVTPLSASQWIPASCVPAASLNAAWPATAVPADAVASAVAAMSTGRTVRRFKAFP
jgi:hypothetical protein